MPHLSAHLFANTHTYIYIYIHIYVFYVDASLRALSVNIYTLMPHVKKQQWSVQPASPGKVPAAQTKESLNRIGICNNYSIINYTTNPSVLQTLIRQLA